jgi:hypothetical protein
MLGVSASAGDAPGSTAAGATPLAGLVGWARAAGTRRTAAGRIARSGSGAGGRAIIVMPVTATPMKAATMAAAANIIIR